MRRDGREANESLLPGPRKTDRRRDGPKRAVRLADEQVRNEERPNGRAPAARFPIDPWAAPRVAARLAEWRCRDGRHPGVEIPDATLGGANVRDALLRAALLRVADLRAACPRLERLPVAGPLDSRLPAAVRNAAHAVDRPIGGPAAASLEAESRAPGRRAHRTELNRIEERDPGARRGFASPVSGRHRPASVARDRDRPAVDGEEVAS